jgi:hypothetical protein
MTIYKISKWHKITAEKDGNQYTIFDSVKSVFGDTWQKKEIRAGLTLAQVKEIQNLYK